MALTRRESLSGLVAVTYVTASPALSKPKAKTVRVQTRFGPVEGYLKDGIATFKGLRYGADTSPVRFAAPRPPESWSKSQQARQFGPASPQNSQEPNQSEDCLFLNLYTPCCDDKRRAVMVYFHGGAYMTGSGSDPLYDGSNLCALEDVVVVTVNHRLNAFGYLYLAQLARGTPFAERLQDSGNAGQLDLILALSWVRDHIALFGGDPARIMVFGQSGGGAKIATLMAQPAAKGLFHRAATMSGQQVTASGPNNATRRALAVLEKLGLKPDEAGFKAVLSMPVAELLGGLKAIDPVIGSGGVYMGPVLDERHLLRHPFYPDAAPQGLDIPMMIGNTREETRYFLQKVPNVHALSWEELPAILPSNYRVDIDSSVVIDTYRKLYPDYSPTEVFFAATTAGRSWRGAIIEAEERAKANAPAFVYQLDWKSPKDDGKWGACHTLDIGLVFNNTAVEGALTGDSTESRKLARYMSHAFATFAKVGNPQTEDLPTWTPYGLKDRETLIFDVTPRMENDPRGGERRLFEKVPFVQQGT